jgi:hypothetical protein
MIIFLDIDGVLVHLEYNPSARRLRQDFDPKCVAVLNRLVKETGAKIVISSTWRHLYPLAKLRDIFEEAGFTGEIIGVTPIIINRGDEILKWIQDNNYEGHYLVIDDDVFDIEPYKDIPHENIIHVKDGFETGGLKEEHVSAILSIGMIS